MTTNTTTTTTVDTSDEVVLIPAVTVPAGYIEKAAAMLEAIDIDKLQEVAETVYRDLLPRGDRFDLLEGDMFELAGERSGWMPLWTALVDVASAFTVAAGITGGELHWPGWMPEEDRMAAEVADLCKRFPDIDQDDARVVVSRQLGPDAGPAWQRVEAAMRATGPEGEGAAR